MDSMHLYQRGKTWWLRFTDHRQKTRRLRGATNRRTAEGIARRVAKLVEDAAAGAPPADDLVAWVHSIDAKRRARLVEWEIVSPTRMVAGEPLADQLERWRQGLLNRGRAESYADKRHGCAKRLFEACEFRSFADIDAERVLAVIEEWRRAGRLPEWKRKSDVSENTLAHHVSAAKAFTRWMDRHGYVARDPLAVLSVERRKPRPEATRSRAAQRRALGEDEQRRLITTAAAEPDRYGMTGAQRSLLYRVALGTGLRAGAIRRLTCGDIDLEQAVVGARGSGASNKDSSPKPMTPSLVRAVRAHLKGRAPSEPLFSLPSEHNMARMLREDAEAAGLDLTGVDFHALRHSFGSALARKGVHPKTLMSLMDHSDINITMRLYTHSFPEDEASAVAQLPDLEPAPEGGEEPARAAG